LANQEDVNGDGLIDLVCKIETENLDPGTFQDGRAFLNGVGEDDFGDPIAIEGFDLIIIVPE
jgi:hypothetical protein